MTADQTGINHRARARAAALAAAATDGGQR